MDKGTPSLAGMAAAEADNCVAIRETNHSNRKLGMCQSTRSRALRTVPVTYAALTLALVKKASGDGASQSAVQRGRNAKSTLNAWRSFIGRNIDDVVSSEFDERFDELSSDFLEHEQKRCMALITLRDRRRWIRVARDILVRLRQEGFPDTFGGCLDALIKRSALTIHAIAARVGLDPKTLRLWTQGQRIPGLRAQSVEALEALLGAAPRTLLSRLPAAVRRRAKTSTGAAQQRTAYGERIRKLKLRKERYGLSHITPALRSEWRALLEYKTENVRALERTPKGIWRIRPRTDMRYQRPEWIWALDADRVVPTAAVLWQHVQPFLGWLALAREKGGLGFSSDQVQTLTWLTRADLVTQYLAWRAKRAGGYNGGSVTLLVSLCTLLHPETGFFSQQPEFGQTLPSAYLVSSADWRAFCAQAHDQLNRLRHKIAPQVVQTRNAWEPLRSLVGLRNCLAPIAAAIRAMRKELPGPTSPLQRAQAIRDILIVELFIANPLRVNQWALVRYRKDNSGHLYRSENGWRVRFESREFKNADGAAGEGPYDVRLPQRAWSAIDEYLKEARHELLRGSDSDYLIVGGTTPGTAPWSGIDAVIRRVCKRFLPGGPSIGPQAFRKLVTTFWLKKSGRNYVAAASLLNDRLETVVADYAHLETEHAFDDYSNALDDVFGP